MVSQGLYTVSQGTQMVSQGFCMVIMTIRRLQVCLALPFLFYTVLQVQNQPASKAVASIHAMMMTV